MLTSIIGVVVLLGGLIFFHELGHYTIAKLFGVKVEVFSLGFGKKLFRRQIGETEYALSLFPLGGYVKLMGDDPFKGVPAHEADRAFSTQKLYKRFLIVAAGPLANLLLAIVLFSAVFYFGQPVASSRVGSVTINSPAWEAGLRPGDRILEISDHKMANWSEVEEFLRTKSGERVELKIDRDNTELKIPFSVTEIKSRNNYGEEVVVGGLKGVSPARIEPSVGISQPKSVAYQAGIRTGDVITKIDTQAIEVFEDINDYLNANWKPGAALSFTLKRKIESNVVDKNFSLVLPAKPTTHSAFGLAESLGLYPTEVFIFKVSPDSPAEKGGLKAGDRIVSVGEKPTYSFESIVDQVQEAGTKNTPATFVVERNGEKISLKDLKPTETTQEDPYTRQSVKKFMVGFVPHTALKEPELTSLKIRNPVKLISHAVSETFTLAGRMVVSLAKLAVGQISVKNLGGPVLIASVAGKSLDAGIIPFLQMMALISINLFLLNLFPVPVLDGGHLLFFALEAIKGKPVSLRTMEIANQIGMVFILLLVGLTLFNDISRIIFH